MFDFRWIRLFSLGYRLSKHKMTIYDKHFRRHGPPGYAYSPATFPPFCYQPAFTAINVLPDSYEWFCLSGVGPFCLHAVRSWFLFFKDTIWIHWKQPLKCLSWLSICRIKNYLGLKCLKTDWIILDGNFMGKMFRFRSFPCLLKNLKLMTQCCVFLI